MIDHIKAQKQTTEIISGLLSFCWQRLLSKD